MDMSKYRDLFLSETREHLNSMNQLLLALEQEPANRETIDALFREAHSIKGMAASMGHDRTAELAHHLEDYLDEFRSSGQVPSQAVDRLLAGLDLLEGLLEDLEQNRQERDIADFFQQRPDQTLETIPLIAVEEEPCQTTAETTEETTEEEPSNDAEVEESETPPQPEPEVFQVNVNLSEQAAAAAARGLLILRELQKAGELLSTKPTREEMRAGEPCRQIQAWLRTSLSKDHLEAALAAITDVEQVTFIDDRRKDNPRESGARTVRVRTDLLDQFVNLTGELITQRYMMQTASSSRSWEDMDNALSGTRRLIEDLHHHVLQARMMPLESITGRLPRIIRDLCRKSGKQVAFQLVGGGVGIDRVILEAMTDPLVHLVRNAIDHGIAETGEVVVSARREKDLVLIEVSDNGSGMDPALLRDKAIARGLLTPTQAEALSDRDALLLICQPGFSTMTEVTETSGRGVGMDVVKAAVETLGGTLEIHSTLGQGTRFQLRLPLSIAIIKILLVSCGGQPLAIPVTRVVRTLDLPSSTIQKSGGHRVFSLDEDVIRLISLSELLDLPTPPAEETTWVILTEVQGRRFGLQVDRFLGQRDAFVKSLGFPLNRLSGLSGATVDGDGSLLFIIDPQTLLEEHTASATPD
jgi:two-component system chemotaxis sensor kinase CheA